MLPGILLQLFHRFLAKSPPRSGYRIRQIHIPQIIYQTQIGKHRPDLFALIKLRSTQYLIRNLLLNKCFLQRTCLGSCPYQHSMIPIRKIPFPVSQHHIRNPFCFFPLGLRTVIDRLAAVSPVADHYLINPVLIRLDQRTCCANHLRGTSEILRQSIILHFLKIPVKSNHKGWI